MNSDVDRQRRELALPSGLPGSGRRRYAAAMWLHMAGEIPENALEVYRILALDDSADPLAELRRAGLAPVAKSGNGNPSSV